MATQQVNVRLAPLTAAGTSVWLDQIKRGLITTGELLRLVEGESLRGVTSDPTVFYQAILGSEDYDEQLAGAARAGDGDAGDLSGAGDQGHSGCVRCAASRL